MFNLQIQNNSIDLIQLKTLLCSRNGSFLLWTFLAHKILVNHHLSSCQVDNTSTTNSFLQLWNVKINALPYLLCSMLHTAQKYGTTFKGILPSNKVKTWMLLWFHLGENQRKQQINNSASSKCLRHNHKVIHTGQAMQIAKRLSQPDHTPNKDCSCTACAHDRNSLHCSNPHACARTAKAKLNSLLPKWDPCKNTEMDLITLTEAQVLESSWNSQNDHPYAFDPKLQLADNAEGFQILTKIDTQETSPVATVRCPLPTDNPDTHLLTVTQNDDKVMGCSMFFRTDNQRN